MNKIYILGLGLLFSAMAFAQSGEKDNRKAIEAYRVAYMTQHLQLTPEEAQKFWPVYNQMQNELKALREQRKRKMQELKSTGNQQAIADYELAHKQRELNVVKKHHTSLKQAMPAQKVAKLYNTEKNFRTELKQRMQEHRQKNMQNNSRNNSGPKVRTNAPPRANPAPPRAKPTPAPQGRPSAPPPTQQRSNTGPR